MSSKKKMTPPFSKSNEGEGHRAAWGRISEALIIAVAGPVVLVMIGYFLALPALELRLGVAGDQIQKNQLTAESNAAKLSEHRLATASHPTITQSVEWQKELRIEQQTAMEGVRRDLATIHDDVRALRRTVERRNGG